MSELDPLLVANSPEDTVERRQNENNNAQEYKPRPIPWLQVSLIVLIQLAEPITASVIFPFINQLIQQTGITNGDEKKTGYYAGIVESIFFVMESLTAVAWGRASDRFGRRPILLIGLIILTTATFSFGLTHMYWWIMLCRALQGACNGNIGVTKSVMAEVTDPVHVAKVFGTIPVMWSFGVTIGPTIGGIFAEPAARWPDTFGKLEIFREYPYFLPCAISAIYVALVFLLSLICLKESLPSASQKRKCSLSENNTERRDYGTIAEQPSETTTLNEPAPIRDLFTRPALIVLSSYGFLSFIDQSIGVLLPLFWSTSIEAGGLGMSAHRIGSILGIFGFINGFIQLVLFPPLLNWLGARKLYIVGSIALLFNVSFFIASKYFVNYQRTVDYHVMTCIVLQLVSTTLVYVFYGSVLVLFIEVAPPGALGTMNGLAQALSTVARSFAPAFSTSLFSVTLERRLWDGAFVFIMLWVIAALGVAVSFATPKSSK